MRSVIYRRRRVSHGIKRAIGRIRYKNMLLRNKNVKILVILHLFYDESWKEIVEYLKNLNYYNYKLLVTVTENRISEQTLNDIRSIDRDARIVQVPNRGFDLGPFFEVISYIQVQEYDLIIKLHSKGTKRFMQYIYDQFFFRRSWFLDLFDGLLSAASVHRVIDIICNDPSVSIVAADNLLVKDPIEKARLYGAFGKPYGLCLPDSYLFVAGTCLAMSPGHVGKLQKLGFSIDSFDKSASESVEDLAHFLERFMCVSNGKIIGIQSRTLAHVVRKPIGFICRFMVPALKKVRHAIHMRWSR